VPNIRNNRHLPAGFNETLPLIVGVIAISIPVALLVVAAVGESVVVLVLAVLAMLAVGAATLTFVILLAGDAPGHLDGGEAGGE
jgi:hypothetical protein